MSDKGTRDNPFNVLFLCTGNSARSILAESILNRLGAGRFRAYSAGSHPKGQVNPRAVELLKRLNYATDQLRSKSWDEFAGDAAPKMDFVFTVCDDAASEVCPIWPGQPMTAHWGQPDPSNATGSESEIAFAWNEAYRMLSNRLTAFTNLPLTGLDRLSLQKSLDALGRREASAERR